MEAMHHRSFLSFPASAFAPVAGDVGCGEGASFFPRPAQQGTVARRPDHVDVRPAPGWLSGRRPLAFLAGRLASLGTGIQTSFITMVRAAPGWLSVRSLMDFQLVRPVAPGTAQPAEHLSSAMESGSYHVPVLPSETRAWMDAAPDRFIIDGTLGGGGHSEMFLEAGATVLGVDRDPEALAHARQRLAAYGERFTTWEGNFSTLPSHPELQAGRRADGLLLDLGVSSRQLDAAERGFSFQKDGPLDMRMGPGSRCTAAEIVNTWSEEQIVKLLFQYGEEPKARRIAAAIIKRREQRAFDTTLDLANYIESTIGRHGRTHPATRTFQAIRMAANEELESLETVLAAVPGILKPGGRLLVITFHSLEDRMVKQFLRRHSAPFIDDPGWPEPRPNPEYRFELLQRKAIPPTAEEVSLNPRARSAKLRVARLLEPTP